MTKLTVFMPREQSQVTMIESLQEAFEHCQRSFASQMQAGDKLVLTENGVISIVDENKNLLSYPHAELAGMPAKLT